MDAQPAAPGKTAVPLESLLTFPHAGVGNPTPGREQVFPGISWGRSSTSGSVCFVSFVIVLYSFNFPAGQWEGLGKGRFAPGAPGCCVRKVFAVAAAALRGLGGG